MSTPRHVLVLGGHGKIAQLLTPLLLKRAWTVTSMIRKAEQVPTIEKLGEGLPGKLNVLVSSIEDVTTKGAASGILQQVNPDFIAWSAGAGGKGGPESTMKVDRDAAINFVEAAAEIPSISKFLLVSYNGNRRACAPWWQADEWQEYNEKVNYGVLATYHQAKIAADEAFYKATNNHHTLVGICLRPGTLNDEPTGTVSLGRQNHVKGQVPRASVAAVADALLATEGVKSTWLDLLSGDGDVQAEVARCVKDGVSSVEGEAIAK